MLNAIEDVLGQILAFFYDLIPSFGLSIIFLTILINLVLFPLTLKQTRSTRAFQVIQPEIKRIQKEFKDEPETMQRELMRVQKEAGATPFGCLGPIVVQMPIWFALFRLLRDVADISNSVAVDKVPLPEGSALLAAVQNGQTDFLGMNLGGLISSGITGGTILQAIPYAMLIVIMVASQYFQQWHAQRGTLQNLGDLTPQQRQQQQTQQVLTRVMPLFIGFISWNFPAGLGVYWATGNVFRLLQQFAIFAIDGRPPVMGAGSNGDDKPKGRAETESSKGDTERDETKSNRPHPVSEKKRRRRRK